jgi:hypothetical protein
MTGNVHTGLPLTEGLRAGSCRWPLVTEVARKVLGWRLRLLPYTYSAFYDSHTLGCPVARPLFASFPADAATLRLREQWMMGALHGNTDTYGFLGCTLSGFQV